MPHIPVLLQEVLTVLAPHPGEFFIDGTLGAGGHAAAIMQKLGKTGIFLGVDRDRRAIENFRLAVEKNKTRPKLVHLSEASYVEIPKLLELLKLQKADGLLLDLGFSSDQIDEAEEGGGRGFSFRYDEPLLMTYDNSVTPVKDLLRELSEDELTKIISEFGEERYASRIARNIKARGKQRAIQTTKELSEIICQAVPKNYERGRIHPATRTFMALRIYANQELEHLSLLLENLPKILNSGGRVAIISFHSLEDRIVKHFFKDHEFKASVDMTGEQSKREIKVGYLQILTKKPIEASENEIKLNPRARSAKLRAAKLM